MDVDSVLAINMRPTCIFNLVSQCKFYTTPIYLYPFTPNCLSELSILHLSMNLNISFFIFVSLFLEASRFANEGVSVQNTEKLLLSFSVSKRLPENIIEHLRCTFDFQKTQNILSGIDL